LARPANEKPPECDPAAFDPAMVRDPCGGMRLDAKLSERSEDDGTQKTERRHHRDHIELERKTHRLPPLMFNTMGEASAKRAFLEAGFVAALRQVSG
jgi:hypothetical protein